MKWLPAIFKNKAPIKVEVSDDLTIREEQTKALTTIADSLRSLTRFISEGGLVGVLSGYARSQAVKDILGGLAAHDGRNALDARVLDQNALEITQQVEKVFKKYQDTLQSKEKVDPNLHDGEEDFKKWVERKKNDTPGV